MDAIVRECTSLYIPEQRVCFRKHRFCLEPLTSCQKSDVSRLRETRSQNYTWMYSFDGRCAVYLQKITQVRKLPYKVDNTVPFWQ